MIHWLRRGHDVFIAHPAGEILARQIVAIGKNYAQHAREMGGHLPGTLCEHPTVFSKNPASLAINAEPIRIPPICDNTPQVDFEGELAVVIGRACTDAPPERALEHVLGYAAGNDVSARWWQKEGSGGQFYRGKSFDTFCPVSSITPASAVPDPQTLRVITRLNGVVMQDDTTDKMTFPVATIVSELSRGTTLLPGTIILTGTPSGVGTARTPPVYLRSGDCVEVEIPGVGTVVSAVTHG